MRNLNAGLCLFMKITPDLIDDEFEFSIPNFESFNPRKDLKRHNWIRLDKHWYNASNLHDSSAYVLCMWPVLLASFAGKPRETKLLKLSYLAKMLKVRKPRIASYLCDLHNRGLIVVHVTRTLRDVPIQTNEQTNERIIPASKNSQASKPKKSTESKEPKREAKSSQTWEAYRSAYHRRYRIDPPRNAEINRNLCSLIDKVGQEDAAKLASFYLSIDDEWLKKRFHPVRNLIQDYQNFLTRMKLGQSGSYGRPDDVERI